MIISTLSRRVRDALASHKKRAKAVGLSLDYTASDLRTLVEEALGYPCKYCRYPLTETSWSCDHTQPTSRLGSFCLWNVQIICRDCNQKKGKLTGVEFDSLVTLVRDWHPDGASDMFGRLKAGGGSWKRGRR